MTTPLKTVHTDRYLVELWDNAAADAKRPRRLTVKVRWTPNTAHALQAVHLFTTTAAADEAFARYADAAVPTNPTTPTPKTKRGKR